MVFQGNLDLGGSPEKPGGDLLVSKAQLLGEGIHDGGFLSPGENALSFAAVFMSCMFLCHAYFVFRFQILDLI